MQPIDAYLMYCAMKAHFDKSDYDFIKYNGKSKVSRDSFYNRNDRIFFVKLTRKHKSKQDIQDYLLANFLIHPKGWVGKFDENNYTEWKKKIQSLSYIFKEETHDLFTDRKVDEVFDCTKGHPPILRNYLSGKTSLETLVICDRIFEYGKEFDQKLNDPVWETVSLKIKKYSPFLNINVPRYKKILKEIVL